MHGLRLPNTCLSIILAASKELTFSAPFPRPAADDPVSLRRRRRAGPGNRIPDVQIPSPSPTREGQPHKQPPAPPPQPTEAARTHPCHHKFHRRPDRWKEAALRAGAVEGWRGGHTPPSLTSHLLPRLICHHQRALNHPCCRRLYCIYRDLVSL